MRILFLSFWLSICCCSCFVSCALAQSSAEYLKTSLEIHVGGMFPSGDLDTVFGNAPIVGGTLGYRFMRNVQVEGGFDAAFGAAGVKSSGQLSGGGSRSITDREYFLLLGGRLVLPFRQEKLLLSAGAGGAVLNYNEVPVGLPGEQIFCSGCGSRQGGGYYLLMGLKGMVNPHFGVGVTVKSIAGKTEGDRLDTRLPFRSQDKWTSVAITFSFHR